MKITKPKQGTINFYETKEGRFEVTYDEYNGYKVKTPRGYTQTVRTIKEVKKIIS